MSRFITLITNLKNNKKFKFIYMVIGFYLLLLCIYFYLMYADLSSAPDFVYNDF